MVSVCNPLAENSEKTSTLAQRFSWATHFVSKTGFLAKQPMPVPVAWLTKTEDRDGTKRSSASKIH